MIFIYKKNKKKIVETLERLILQNQKKIRKVND